MKRIRIVGLCLVAVFAMSAVVAASASAAKFEECAKAKGGNYTSKECTPASKVSGTGKYELVEVKTPSAFTAKSGVSTLTSYIKGIGIVGSVTCKSSKSAGNITSPISVVVKTVEFKTCTSSGEKCASAGQKAGTIDTKELLGMLVLYTVGEVSKIGILFASTKGSSEPSAEFKCGAESIKTTGSVIGAVSSKEGASKEATETFAVNAGGENEISEDSEEPGKPNVLLTEVAGVGTFESGENTTDTVKYKAEIEAVH